MSSDVKNLGDVEEQRGDTKDVAIHLDTVAKDENEVVVDADAKGYVDHTLVIDDETNKRLRRLIHWRVLTCMCLCYMGQGLDKGTVSVASIMGMQEDSGMHGQDYALATTVFWIGLIAGQFPANRLAQILPLGKFIGSSLILWGIVLIIMGVVPKSSAILGMRTILGILEAVCGPVLLAMSVMWYRRNEQPWVVNFYQSFNAVSSIISHLLGYGFYHLKKGSSGKLYNWQWMFVTIALISIVFGLIVLWILPDSPPKAKCYSEEDKRLMVERVRVNDQGIKNPKWNWDQFKEACTDIYTYILFTNTFLNTLVVGGLGTFSNLLVNKAFNFDVLQSQLLGMPIGTMGILLYALGAWVVTKTNQTIYTVIGFAVCNWVGTIVLITVAPSEKTRGGLLAAFYVLQCYQAQNPLLFQLCSRNIAGQTKRTVCYTVTFIGWAVGNAIGPQLFVSTWAPRYLNTLYIHIGIYFVHFLLLIGTRMLLVHRNKQKEKAAGGVAVSHIHAFEDLTDRQNPDFRYIL